MRRARAAYTWESVADQLQTVYRRVCAQRTAAAASESQQRPLRLVSVQEPMAAG
jgi:hypothetical protein